MNVCSTIAYAKQLNKVMQVTPKQQLVKIRAAALRDMDGEVLRLALVFLRPCTSWWLTHKIA